MAYNVSEDYKKVIYSGNAKHKLKIFFGGVELENADMYCEKITRKSRIIPNGSKGFYLDKFVGQELECIFHELDMTKIVNPVNVSIGTLVNNAYEYVPLGIFNIQDKPETDKNKVTIKLLDNSVKFDFNYDGKPLIEQNGGKATKGQIFNDICSKAGVTTKVTNFEGFNDEIGTYDNTIKARKYISYFAEQSGAIATIDRDGELIFVYLNNLATHEIPLEIVESYEKGEPFKISRIVYEDGIRKFENGLPSANLFNFKTLSGDVTFDNNKVISNNGDTISASLKLTKGKYYLDFKTDRNVSIFVNTTSGQYVYNLWDSDSKVLNLKEDIEWIYFYPVDGSVSSFYIEDLMISKEKIPYEPYGISKKDTLFLDTANPYINSQEQVNKIFNIVNGFQIDSLKTGKIYGNPAIDGYDLIEIREKGNNLFDGIWESGTIDYNKGDLFFSSNTIRTKNYIPINYLKISIKQNEEKNCKLRFYDENKNYIGGDEEQIFGGRNHLFFSFIPPKNARYLKLAIDQTNNLDYKLMCNIGEVVPYEPYKNILIGKTLATNNLIYNGVMTTSYETQIEAGDKQENTSFKDTPATLKKYVNSQIDQVNGTIKLQSGQIEENKSKINTLEITSNSTTSKIEKVEKDITTINDNVSSLDSSVSGLDKNITNLGNNLSSLDGKVSSNTQEVESLKSTTSKLTQTDTEIKASVTKVEESITKTNSNVSSLDSKIDGVSASFTDFKDNEYIKSIGNLQDQIDGAIQFWNGAEIPTLNNYPANEWTTEDERNNHRADIYTVIKDVNGELKQGKGYRFDKVGNNWKWIELTDNELSAVQKIAQDGLDKANSNAIEIGILKKTTSELVQTDTEIKASVSKVEKNVTTINGNIEGLNNNVSDINKNITSLNNNVSDLSGKVGSNTTEIGTLKEKTTELAQTDSQIKASVSSLEKETVLTSKINGSNIHIEDGAEATFVDFSVDGKSYQETRESYNLCPNNFQSQKVSGVDFVRNEDGTITANGTSTAIIESEIIICENQKFPKGKIFISGTPTGGGTNFTYGIKYNINNSSSTKTIGALGNLIENTSEDNLWKITAFVSSEKQVNNILFKPMITLEKDKGKPYMPYGNMPSPDYPSEIKSVGYANLFDGIIEIGKLNENNGSPIFMGGRTRSVNFIPAEPNTEYTFTREIGRWRWIFGYDENKIGVVDGNFENHPACITNTLDKTFTFKTTPTTHYIKWYDNDSVDLNEKVMIEEGEREHQYIAYGKYGLNVTNIGKNLIDTSNITTKVGYFSGDGTINDGGSSTIILDYLPIIPNTNLSLSGSGKETVCFYDKDKKFIKRIITSSSTLVINENASFIRIQFTTSVFDKDKIQLELGTTPSPYEPYQAYNTQIILPEQLKSVTEKDKLVRKNGVWGIEKKIGKVILNGSENFSGAWGNKTNTISYLTENIPNDLIVKDEFKNYLKCNYFKGIARKPDSNLTDTEFITAGIGYIAISIQKKLLNEISINGLKQWLKEKFDSGNPVIVQYELETPEFIPLDDLEQEKLNKIATFKGTNNITTTDELEPNLNLEYVRDTNMGNFVNSQIDGVKTTTEKKIAELIIKDDEISAEVKNVSTVNQNNYQELNTKFDGYTPKSDTVELEKSVKQIQTDTYTKTEINTKLIDGSVTKVQTISGTFDENGMHYEKTNAPTKSTINERGVSVDDSISDRELLFAGYDDTIKQTIVRTENLTVRKYLVVGDHTRIEKYGNGGGLFTL